jgi:hypothetical protein
MTQPVQGPELSGVRRALRERDPAALGVLLASQLAAHRCSTVYGPSASVIREVIEDQALPRLEKLHDVRKVVVREWPGGGGPSLAGLELELLRQLGLAAPPEALPPSLGAVRQVVERAHRVSDRPLVIVLYGLEQLLDDGRDRGADQKIVDALAALVDLPIRGLQLVMAVPEADLGAFRHLLRGRWRMLANDIRLHGDGGRLIIPIGLVGTSTLKVAGAAAAGKAGIVAGVIGGVLGVAGIVLSVVGANDLRAAEEIRDSAPPQIPAAECPACEACPECPAVASANKPQPDDPQPADSGPDAKPDGPDEQPDGPDGPNDLMPLKPPDKFPGPIKLIPTKTPTMCDALASDGPCAKCVRSSCCKELKTCASAKWRKCVLEGKTPSPQCAPDAIEKGCRGLALCALEYTPCNKLCYLP